MRARVPFRAVLLAALLGTPLVAQTPATQTAATGTAYLTPPQAIVTMIDAAPIPSAIVSPSRQMVALLQRRSNPPIAELARPMHGLAGTRVNPKTNGPHRTSGIVGLSFKRLDGAETKVALPAGTTIDSIGFSPDGSRF